MKENKRSLSYLLPHSPRRYSNLTERYQIQFKEKERKGDGIKANI